MFASSFRHITSATVMAVVAVFALLSMPNPADAMKIQKVKSPGGLEAWLVEEHKVPLLALRFLFEGGSSQDPKGKEGVANFVSGMLDEGAGDLDALTFQKRVEDIAMRLSFNDARDAFYGSVETLTANRDQAADLLRLALTSPRFDDEAVERVRGQISANLAFAAKDPDRVAEKAWYKAAYGEHPYGRPPSGTAESVAAISRADLVSFARKNFARDNLKIVAVGDIDAKALGDLIDRVFGGLPAKAELTPVKYELPTAKGRLDVIEMNVPQSVAIFGLGAMKRKDPDFMAAFVMNQILGGGGFASRLMEEVREKRGLAYSVYSYLSPYRHTSLFAGGVATKNDEIVQSLDVIKGELKRMASDGPTAEELENAKSYLTGSYALRYDTNSKIANQLLGILQEDLGIDYVDRRNAEVNAVTMDDVKRVARKLLDTENLIVTVVGKPKGMPPTTQSQ